MSKINLLPWRAELRARQKKQFLATLGASALLGALASGMIFSYYSAHVSGQKDRNAYLEEQIELGKKKIEEIKDLDTKKQRLISRKEVIDTLQADRSRVVRLFESLVKATPDGVVLTLVKQDEQGMTIEGRAQSNTRVSTYMRNLEASGWMKNPDLSVIEATKPLEGFEAFPFEFKLVVGLAKPEDMPAAAIIDPVPSPVPVEAVMPVQAPTSSTVAPGVSDPGAATVGVNGVAPATPSVAIPVEARPVVETPPAPPSIPAASGETK